MDHRLARHPLRRRGPLLASRRCSSSPSAGRPARSCASGCASSSSRPSARSWPPSPATATGRRPAGRGRPLLAVLLVDDEAVAHDALARLREALADFDAATIATTHQFCHRCCDGLGVAGDTDAHAQLVEDLDDLLVEVVDDLCPRALTRPGRAPARSRWAAPAASPSRARWSATPRRASSRPTPTPARRPARGRRSPSRVRDELDRRKRRLGRARLRRPAQPARRRPARTQDAPARQRMRRALEGRARRRVPGHRPGAVAGARPGLLRRRDDGAHRRPQAGHLRLPRRRRRHLPRGGRTPRAARDPRHQPAQRRRRCSPRSRRCSAERPSATPDRRARRRGPARGSPAGRGAVRRRRSACACSTATRGRRPAADRAGRRPARSTSPTTSPPTSPRCSPPGAPLRRAATSSPATWPCCAGPRPQCAARAASRCRRRCGIYTGAWLGVGPERARDDPRRGRGWLALLEAMEQPHRSDRVRAAALTPFVGADASGSTPRGTPLTDGVAEHGPRLGATCSAPAASPPSSRRPPPTASIAERVLVAPDGRAADDRPAARRGGAARGRAPRGSRPAGADRVAARQMPTSTSPSPASGPAGSTPTPRRSSSSRSTPARACSSPSSTCRCRATPGRPDAARPCATTTTRAGAASTSAASPSTASSPGCAAEELAEELRLLYVALTRAQSQVVDLVGAQCPQHAGPPRCTACSSGAGRGRPGADSAAAGRPHRDRRAREWEGLGGPVVERRGPPRRRTRPDHDGRRAGVRAFHRGVDHGWTRTSYTGLSAAAEQAAGAAELLGPSAARHLTVPGGPTPAVGGVDATGPDGTDAPVPTSEPEAPPRDDEPAEVLAPPGPPDARPWPPRRRCRRRWPASRSARPSARSSTPSSSTPTRRRPSSAGDWRAELRTTSASSWCAGRSTSTRRGSSTPSSRSPTPRWVRSPPTTLRRLRWPTGCASSTSSCRSPAATTAPRPAAPSGSPCATSPGSCGATCRPMTRWRLRGHRRRPRLRARPARLPHRLARPRPAGGWALPRRRLQDQLARRSRRGGHRRAVAHRRGLHPGPARGGDGPLELPAAGAAVRRRPPPLPALAAAGLRPARAPRRRALPLRPRDVRGGRPRSSTGIPCGVFSWRPPVAPRRGALRPARRRGPRVPRRADRRPARRSRAPTRDPPAAGSPGRGGVLRVANLAGLLEAPTCTWPPGWTPRRRGRRARAARHGAGRAGGARGLGLPRPRHGADLPVRCRPRSSPRRSATGRRGRGRWPAAGSSAAARCTSTTGCSTSTATGARSDRSARTCYARGASPRPTSTRRASRTALDAASRPADAARLARLHRAARSRRPRRDVVDDGRHRRARHRQDHDRGAAARLAGSRRARAARGSPWPRPTGKAAARMTEAVQTAVPDSDVPAAHREQLSDAAGHDAAPPAGVAARQPRPGSATTGTTRCRTTSSSSTRPRWSR